MVIALKTCNLKILKSIIDKLIYPSPLQKKQKKTQPKTSPASLGCIKIHA